MLFRSDVVCDGPLALEQLTQRDDGKQLHLCLAQLDTTMRKMIVDAYLFGMSRDALSKKFGLPVATIKTQLRRNLGRLRIALAEDGPRAANS